MAKTFKWAFAQMGIAFLGAGLVIMFRDQMYLEASVCTLISTLMVGLCWIVSELE